MGNAKRSRQAKITQYTNVQAGIDKHVASGATLGGVQYTNASLKAVFSGAATSLASADAAHKQWQDTVKAAKGAQSNADDVYDLLRSYALAQFGKDASTALNDFGMNTPKPRGPMTVEAKAVAVQKREATRQARHTMGPVQKKAVKGTVEVPAASVPTTTAPPVAGPVASPVGNGGATKSGS